ncbi:hypothetical protein K493DRAFT_339871 [Basidiobolus meristosporus CBS 931.73]|uniref:Uncharacterized protein n=1 Tax=Basidiobolus meristosporus CBS 931.73 TaxID=1314790 RepID=A0A1Y1XY16_9FUNG|nr:hypothetical protein K493DRAFT_339871 [Basidiobolus meristosporus CBS 931.73]|eukprot:ORX90647.1 hypothetical protein K493DRAFT_339871 [Basidiobolus meristosporus CBS 931.73]
MLKRRAIEPSDFEAILASDIDVYPTESPLTLETLQKWYTHHPEFGMVYYHDGFDVDSGSGENSSEPIVIGACSVVPLTAKGWLKLSCGEVIESQLEEDMLFNNAQPSGNCEIGLHIYHMERYPTWSSFSAQTGNKEKLGTLVLKSIQEILDQLRVTNRNLKVIGLSGLCVSTAGINLFSNYYNCREREDYICREYILRAPSNPQLAEIGPRQCNSKSLVVVETSNQETLTRLLEHGYQFITRCKMLVLKPEDCSVVWHHIKA